MKRFTILCIASFFLLPVYVVWGDTTYFEADYEEDSEGANPSEFDSVTETNGTCNAEAAARRYQTYGLLGYFVIEEQNKIHLIQ